MRKQFNYIKMYKFTKFDDPSQILGNSTNTNFSELLKSKWIHVHDETNIFRYKVTNLQERVVDGKYLLQLNPDRAIKRRLPEQIDNICQPFDDKKFNFNKTDAKEKLFNISRGVENETILTVMVNVSPISPYHSLICPSLDKNLPQIVTEGSLCAVLNMMFYANHRDLRVAYNSLCAMATVNHLHYHLLIETHTLPVEDAKVTQLKGPLYMLEDYPVPGFCFQISVRIAVETMSRHINKLISLFLSKSIAHNMFITRGTEFLIEEHIKVAKREVKDSVCSKNVVRIIIWPRKSSSGVKQLNAFNVASLELSGWFPVYDQTQFDKLTTENLELELKKWKFDDFDNLSQEVKSLF